MSLHLARNSSIAAANTEVAIIEYMYWKSKMDCSGFVGIYASEAKQWGE